MHLVDSYQGSNRVQNEEKERDSFGGFRLAPLKYLVSSKFN